MKKVFSIVAVAVLLLSLSTGKADAWKRHISFKNKTATAIHVFMDSHREEHDIPGAGKVTFQKANNGDNPTFHVVVNGNEVYSEPIGVLFGFGTVSLAWNGTEIEED